ncbi:GIY-YIG nuclease family protein [Aminipila luticellarii]|uniref:GIY-YIG nuclease family protein n=1 Tax=Aminipila luticellarii TaxID=2507160 RepID=A0A410PYS2_9FIRM|nr:GIY-YIG nuclease family protein [Aminipila luticellarii]QAT43986.1 GIY-YIG nuclease family protein [Aminipila luticellarii]
MNKTNYVYILECGDGTYYTGWTVNLEKRIKEHNGELKSSMAKYTRSRRPVKLIYAEEYEDRSEALKRECAIKKLTRSEKEKLVSEKAKLMVQPKDVYARSL